MSSKKIKFIDKEFYSSKEAISLNSVDLSKIVVSSKWKISDTKYKYFCGYLNNDVIQPLCVILPQVRGYIKYFDDGGKNMSFITDDKEVYKKCNEIWEVVRKPSDRLLLLNRKCFSCFNKYKIVGKGWVKCTKVFK